MIKYGIITFKILAFPNVANFLYIMLLKFITVNHLEGNLAIVLSTYEELIILFLYRVMMYSKDNEHAWIIILSISKQISSHTFCTLYKYFKYSFLYLFCT